MKLLSRAAILIGISYSFPCAFAQTQMDLSTATGWSTINGKNDYTDANSKVPWTSSTTQALSVYNFVGGGTFSGSFSGAYATNPMLQMQTGYIGGTTADDQGVAFRFRLGAYDLSTIGSTGITVLVGMGPSSSADKANFALGASFTVASAAIDSWSVFYIDTDRAGSNGVATPANWVTSATWYTGGGAAKELNIVASSSGGQTQSAFINYQSATDAFVSSASGVASSDAWLTFGITFKALNDGISTTTTGMTNAFSVGSSQFNLAPAVYSGVASAGSFTGTVQDYSNTSGSSAVFTNAIYLNPSQVPEPATYLGIAATALPAGFLAWVRRRRKAVKSCNE